MRPYSDAFPRKKHIRFSCFLTKKAWVRSRKNGKRAVIRWKIEYSIYEIVNLSVIFMRFCKYERKVWKSYIKMELLVSAFKKSHSRWPEVKNREKGSNIQLFKSRLIIKSQWNKALDLIFSVEVLVNLQPRAKQEAQGTFFNLPPRAKREAKGNFVNIIPRAKPLASLEAVSKV